MIASQDRIHHKTTITLESKDTDGMTLALRRGLVNYDTKYYYVYKMLIVRFYRGYLSNAASQCKGGFK